MINQNDNIVCLLQEPYAVRGKLVTQPRGYSVFPSSIDNPCTAVFVPKSLKPPELPQLQTRDCTAVLTTSGGLRVLMASVYLDISLPVVQPWLEELLGYAETHHLGVKSTESSTTLC